MFLTGLAETEAELGSLPMVLVTPIVSAVLATVVALQAPPAHVHHNVIDTPALWTSLALAVLGAAGGVLLVILFLAL